MRFKLLYIYHTLYVNDYTFPTYYLSSTLYSPSPSGTTYVCLCPVLFRYVTDNVQLIGKKIYEPWYSQGLKSEKF